MADAKDIAEEVVYLAGQRKVDFAEVRVVEDSTASTLVEDGRADKVAQSQGRGACVRVLVEGAWGFVSIDTLSRRQLLAALDDSIELARASAERVSDPGMVAEAAATVAESTAPFGHDVRTVDVKEKLLAVKRLEEAARKHGGSLLVNSAVTYNDVVVREVVANTRGTLVEQESSRVFAACRVALSKDGMTQMGYERKGVVGGFEMIEELSADDFSLRAVEKAKILLSARPAPAGTMPVIFDPSATGLFTHEALGHNAEADGVWSGQSLLVGRMGQQIAADCVTIIDEPAMEGKFGYYLFDSEGTPASRRVIIENGVLKEFLHTLETAARLGAAPNGAARAEGHAARPIVRMSNTYTAPGSDSLDAMIKSIDRGVYLKDAQGGYVFTERGQFTCKAGQAVMIEKGELTEPLRDVSVAGLTLEILKNVEMVGSDLEVDWPGFCGKSGQSVPTAIGGPHLKVSSMVVGGRLQ